MRPGVGKCWWELLHWSLPELDRQAGASRAFLHARPMPPSAGCCRRPSAFVSLLRCSPSTTHLKRPPPRVCLLVRLRYSFAQQPDHPPPVENKTAAWVAKARAEAAPGDLSQESSPLQQGNEAAGLASPTAASPLVGPGQQTGRAGYNTGGENGFGRKVPPTPSTEKIVDEHANVSGVVLITRPLEAHICMLMFGEELAGEGGGNPRMALHKATPAAVLEPPPVGVQGVVG